MFDFIEEPLAPPEADKAPEAPPSLEGTVYTMPKHRSSGVQNSGMSKGIVFALGGVGLVIVATLGIVWWFVFRLPPASPAPETPAVESAAPTSEETSAADLERELDYVPPPPAPALTDDTQSPTPNTSEIMDYVRGLDGDSDDLTDMEENIFGSDPAKPDTDSDEYLDGAEVKFLYDPARATSAKLDASGTVALYTNANFKYSILYPSAWVVDAVDKGNKEVLFSSATGEFMNLTVRDNPEKLNATEWYTTVYQPNSDTSVLQTLQYDTWSGVLSPDGREVYMTARDDDGKVITPYVYVLTYDLGEKKEMNFGSVFQMMIRSFLITDLSFKQ